MGSDFYDIHYQKYFEMTIEIDPSPFLSVVADRLERGATVLDIGCGSGRDLLWLRQRGFRPTGFEKSAGLAALARRYSGCPVLEGDFTRHDFSTLRFDAVLSIGAFVHLPPAEFEREIKRIAVAVNKGGLLFLTLKEGSGHTQAGDGRCFTLWRPDDLAGIFDRSGLSVIDFSRNTSALRKEDVWIAYLLDIKRNLKI